MTKSILHSTISPIGPTVGIYCLGTVCYHNFIDILIVQFNISNSLIFSVTSVFIIMSMIMNIKYPSSKLTFFSPAQCESMPVNQGRRSIFRIGGGGGAKVRKMSTFSESCSINIFARNAPQT